MRFVYEEYNIKTRKLEKLYSFIETWADYNNIHNIQATLQIGEVYEDTGILFPEIT